MPQDSLRSVVYRSFVTCDDPKGVVECKPIRKSKKMEDKTKNQRIKQDSNTLKPYEDERKDKVPKGSAGELQNMSSFQIMEVSRGAHKLNEVIDSWSNRTSFDKQSKYIAKDLLKGAIDLQESLAMLGKLQEVSRENAKSKKRHKEKLVEGRDDMPFGDHDPAVDFRKPRISADWSSRDCYDELREVIRESFARQHLLPKVSAKEKDHIDGKKLELCMDFPSSSSSQSSLIQSHTSSCSPSKVQNEKPKGPNLIAKLMGLEEVSSKAVNPVIYRQMEEKKLSNQGTLLLDIDLPRPRKPRFMVQKVAQERRSLEEMIETMQFKGLLGRKSIDDRYHSDASWMRRCSAVEGTPIVLMRPRRVRDHQAEELHKKYRINEEKPIESRQMPRKLREEFPLYALEVPKRRWTFMETNEKLRARSNLKQKLSKDKEDKCSGESQAGVVDKTLDIQDRLSTMKIKHSKPPVPRLQKDEVIGKKISNISKVASNTRKQSDIKDAKSQESVKNQDLGENTTLKRGKIARGYNVSKSQITDEKTAGPDKTMKPASLRSSSPKKTLPKRKPDSKSSAALVEHTQSDDNLQIHTESDIQGSLVDTPTSDQIAKDVTNASRVSISDNSGNAVSSPCETPVLTIEDDVKYIQDSSCIPCHNLDETKCCKSISNTRYLLMSSVSFLSRVEELFDNGTIHDTTVSLPENEIFYSSLLLECAKEILERKSLHSTRTIHPLSQNLFTKPKCHLSLDQLVGDISDGIEDLRSYSKPCGNIVVGDSIHSMLERDVWWNGEVTGTWDLGWRNGFTVEEVNAVVNDVEKLVLSEIVDDIVIEFI